MLNIREVLILDVKLIKIRKRNNRQTGGFIVQANKHIIMLVLFVVFFLGLILGHTFMKNSPELQKKVGSIFTDYINEIIAQPFVKTLTSQLLLNILLLLSIFIFGLCAVGFPLPIIILLTKGLSIGVLSSYIYSEYGLKGFGFCMLIFYPAQIMLCLVLLRAGKESFEMSMNILKYISVGRLKAGENADFKIYFFRYIIFAVITITVALISTVLSVYMVPYFNF